MTLRILLADGSIATQMQGAKILAAAGHDIIRVSNGVAACRSLLETQFDLALLDVYLPGAGGVEVCEKIRTRSGLAHMSVLLTAGRMDPFSSEEAMNVRADGFIFKPFEANRLIPIIEKVASRVRPHDTAISSLSSVPECGPPPTGHFPERRVLEPGNHQTSAGDTVDHSSSNVVARAVMTASRGHLDGEICDACGCVNDRGAFACRRCDIPLPSSVTALTKVPPTPLR